MGYIRIIIFLFFAGIANAQLVKHAVVIAADSVNSLKSAGLGTSGQVLTSNGNADPTWQAGGGGAGSLLIVNNLSDVANANTSLNNLLPSQTSSANKFLKTNGTNSSWDTILVEDWRDDVNNVFLGGCGNVNVIGVGNAAGGVNALLNVASGQYNTAFGFDALISDTSGSFNTAFGENALGGVTTGIENIAIGNEAVFGETTGNNNIGIGNNTLEHNSGEYTIAIGKSAGRRTDNSNTTFHECILMGTHAGDYSDANLTRAFVAGSPDFWMRDVYFGQGIRTGPFSGIGADVTIHATGTEDGSTNTNGGKLILAGGISTGSGSGGDIVFQTSLEGSSGIADNSLSEIARFTTKGFILTIVSVPGSASAAGTTGQIAYDASFIYICTATNTWKRVGISTW